MIPHFSMPLILTSRGTLGALDQDSPLEVANSVALLLDTRPGERRCVPAYGLVDPLGRGVDVVATAETIELWEPRADPADLDLDKVVVIEQNLDVYPANVTEEA